MKLFSYVFKNSLAFVALLCIPSCIGAGEDHGKSLDINNAVGKENLVNIVVVGAGMSGMSAATYLGRSNLAPVILEGHTPGGDLTKTTDVENFPGFAKIAGPELVDRMKKQAEKFGAEFLADSLEKIDFSSWPYKIVTENGMTIHAMSVIIATGSSPRKLNIPGEDEYYGRGVSHCAICDGRFFANEHVVVVGGGDSAVEEAIQLVNFGVEKVTVLVRGVKMRAVEYSQKRLREEEKVFIKHNTQITEILGDGDKITGVKVFDKITKESYVIDVTGVFLAIGSEPNTWFLKNKVDMNAHGYLIMKKRTQETSQVGVYASGAIEEGRPNQAVIAAGAGAQAAVEVSKFLTEELGLNTKMRAKLRDSYYKGKAAKQELLVTEAEVKKIENTEQFNTQVLEEKEKLVLVDFYTDTCPSCLQMMPAIAELAKDYAKKIKVFKIDAANPDIADVWTKYKGQQVPRILLFKEGEVVEDHYKALSRKELSDMVDKHIDLGQKE